MDVRPGPGVFFGPPWPSGICDTGRRAATPVGERCVLCDESVGPDDRGSFVGTADRGWAPVHRECSLRETQGGIGHHEDHDRWCLVEHDPDGGRSYRESARQVWALVTGTGRP